MVSTSFSKIHGSGSEKGGMRQTDWEYKVFRKRFMETREAVFKVAQYLNLEKNLTVMIPSMELAPSIHKSTDFADRGDIISYKTTDGVIDFTPYPIEVKCRSFDFTSKEDYPYPDMMVAQKINCDRANPTAVFIVNKSMTYAFVVKKNTKHLWNVRPTKDKERGDIQDTYTCDFDLGEFIKF